METLFQLFIILIINIFSTIKIEKTIFKCKNKDKIRFYKIRMFFILQIVFEKKT